ncbi:MAG: hypothetical protein ACR2OR_07145 [Hyphomicrobiales bacterium]
MSDQQDYPVFAVMCPHGKIFGATRARSVFEAQFKLAEGLLFPLIEGVESRELIGADLVAAIWRVAEKLGWQISKSSSQKYEMDEVPEDNPSPDFE